MIKQEREKERKKKYLQYRYQTLLAVMCHLMVDWMVGMTAVMKEYQKVGLKADSMASERVGWMALMMVATRAC